MINDGSSGYTIPMEWENLKEEKCPKCGAALSKEVMYVCRFCDFRISLGRAFEIVGKPKDLEQEANALLKKRKKRRRR